jgi:DNA-binding NtrC family response regulator
VRHGWPGNVRELENTIERCIVLGRREEISAEDLPESIGPRGTPLAESAMPESYARRSMAEVEREHSLRVLTATDGNKAAAARMLGSTGRRCTENSPRGDRARRSDKGGRLAPRRLGCGDSPHGVSP